MNTRSFRLVGSECYYDYLEEIREGYALLGTVDNAVEAYFKERGASGFSAELKADIRKAIDSIDDNGQTTPEHRAYFGSDAYLDSLIQRIRAKINEDNPDLEAETRKVLSDLIDKTDDFDELTGAIVQRILSSNLGRAATDSLLKKIAKKTGVSVSSIRPTASEPGANQGEPGRQAVHELNRKHAIVSLSGRVLVMNQEYDPNLKRSMVTFSNKPDFILRYLNRKTVREGEAVDIGTFWLEHENRRQYEAVVFSPGENPEGYYNLFQGFPVKPRPGSYGLFHELMTDVICDQDEELYDYVWRWLAHLFQCPANLPGTALVLRGGQGTGKNTFVDTIGHLVGRHYVPVTNMQQVTGRFSGHLADALLVFANEATWGGDKTAEGALKSIITDGLCTVEKKGKDAIVMPNYKRLIVASNEQWVVPRGVDDRRFIILDVSDRRQRDTAFFDQIRHELENGGYEALMDALLKVDLKKWHPRDIPDRARKLGWDLKLRSSSSVIKWWFSCLDNGYVVIPDSRWSNEPPEWPNGPIPKKHVHDEYLAWCHRHNESHPVIDSLFGRDLKTYGVSSVRPRGENRNYCYLFPTIDEARQIFSDVFGLSMNYWAVDNF